MIGDCAITLPAGYTGFQETLVRNGVLGLYFRQGQNAVSGNHANFGLVLHSDVDSCARSVGAPRSVQL
jgi:hypothetical protein